MDGIREKNVMVVASTNRLHALDPALRRPGRFDKEVEFPLPYKEIRKKFLKMYMEKLPDFLIEKVIDLTEGYTPADIKLLIRELKRKKSLCVNKDLEYVFYEAVKEITPSGLREYKIKFKEDFPVIKNIECDKKEYYYEEDEDAKKIIACLFDKEKIDRVIEVNCIRFMSRFYGETEASINEFFAKIRKFRRTAVWLRNSSAILKDKIMGAAIEFKQGIEDLKEIEDIYVICTK
jgi:SpoVK/Ycf46/Vps4 family AAA+-type ATPase